jgi:MbtH protein
MSYANETESDNHLYKVLVNHEEQYSLWRNDWPDALGWTDTGRTGTRQECLDYVNQIWTDMRPLSLRKRMEANPALDVAQV